MDLFQDYLLCFVAIKVHRNFWCDFPEDYENRLDVTSQFGVRPTIYRSNV